MSYLKQRIDEIENKIQIETMKSNNELLITYIGILDIEKAILDKLNNKIRSTTFDLKSKHLNSSNVSKIYIQALEDLEKEITYDTPMQNNQRKGSSPNGKPR